VTLRAASGQAIHSYPAPLRIAGGKAGIQVHGASANSARNGRYRGRLELRPGAFGAIEAINALGLEDYVRGVVAGESPSTWPAAALEAQAVAARSYAITTSKAGTGFDQFPDTRSQVYNGMSAETPATDAAVKATAGQVVTYAGKPVTTYFFSTSGGQTENIENSFLGATPEPWLVSVDDPYDNASPRHRWVITMSLATASKRLGSLVHGQLEAIKVLKHGVSPRIVRAEVVGTGGTAQVSGPDLRRKLGLYDTWASFSVTNATGPTTTTTPPPVLLPAPPPGVTGPTGTSAGGATFQPPEP
jgi:stage II sporulation protein D